MIASQTTYQRHGLMRTLGFMLMVLITFAVLFKLGYYLLHPGVPQTHDGENHLARFANYVAALKDGQFPPRWAPYLLHGLGYPVFNYNYPLANIFAIPLAALGISYNLILKLQMSVAVVLGAAGWWRWLKQVQLPKIARLIGILAWISAPYLFNIIWVRGTVGELWAIALWPWVALSISEYKNSKASVSQWLVTTALLTAWMLSHNVAMLLLLPLAWSWAVVELGTSLESWKGWLASFAGAVAISLWFWLPALAEKHLIILDTADLSLDFAQHFPSLSQLLLSPLQFGFSYPGSLDTLSFQVGWGLIAGCIVLLMGILVHKQLRVSFYTQPILTWSLFFTAVAVFFQLRISQGVWQVLPLISFVQFPWRFTMIFISVTPLLLAKLWLELPVWSKWGVGLTLTAQIAIWLLAQPVGWVNQPDVFYRNFSQSTSTSNENLPKTFTADVLPDWYAYPVIATGAASTDVSVWTGSFHKYDVTVTEPALIIEPTIAFAGWQTTLVRHQPIPDYKILTATEYWLGEPSKGLLAYPLERGDYTITSQFTQWTWPRVVGNVVSVLGSILWLYYFSWWLLKKVRLGKV